MANAIAIIGNSGSGKSTSMGQIPELGIKGLNPKETFIPVGIILSAVLGLLILLILLRLCLYKKFPNKKRMF